MFRAPFFIQNQQGVLIMSQENQDIMKVEFHCESYTTITNHCLEDTTLPMDARGLLVTMLSLKDDWNYSIAGLTGLGPDGETKIRRMLNDLEEHGYLRRERYRNERGRFKFKYHIYDQSQTYHDENSGKRPENRNRFSRGGNAQKSVFSSKNIDNQDQGGYTNVEKPHVVRPKKEEPNVEKMPRLNTNKTNTDINLIKSINPRATERASTTLPQAEQLDAIDMMERKNSIREAYSEQIDYDRLISEYPEKKKLVDVILRTMTDIIAHVEMDPIKISGCSYSHGELEEVFSELRFEHISYVITCISQSGRAINNPQKYILQCLLQANTRDIYEASRNVRKKQSTFNQFEQNSYDFDELEGLLLDN